MVTVSDDRTSADDDDVSDLPAVDRDSVPFADPPNPDADSYLQEYFRDCPDHGNVIPIALPYIIDRNSREPDGYHLVCPRCRHMFEEYEISNEQWMSR